MSAFAPLFGGHQVPHSAALETWGLLIRAGLFLFPRKLNKCSILAFTGAKKRWATNPHYFAAVLKNDGFWAHRDILRRRAISVANWT